VFGLLFSPWEPANSLFVRDKYVTPTGMRLHAGYVQKAEARKTCHLIPQLAANNTCVWFNGDLLHTYQTILTPQFTFNSNFLWIIIAIHLTNLLYQCNLITHNMGKNSVRSLIPMEMPAGVTNDSRSINPSSSVYELIGHYARPQKSTTI